MKKTYIAPLMEVENLEAEQLIALSTRTGSASNDYDFLGKEDKFWGDEDGND